MPATASKPPVLLKARMRHSRYLVLAVAVLILFSNAMLPVEGAWHEALEGVGYFLVAICALGRLYCTGFIGGLKNETVIRSGPYSVVRNPLYVFSFMGVMGIAMESGMLTVFVLLVGGFLLYYPRVIAREEAFLLHKFGEDYARYKQEVPRWIPNFHLWQEPEEIPLRPKFLKNAFFDAIVWFIPLPLFELLESIHQAGYLTFIPSLP